MKKLASLFNFNRVLIIGTILVIISIVVPSAFAQSNDANYLQQVGTGTPGTPEVTGTVVATGTAGPTESATSTAYHYNFVSPTNECGWGSLDGQVLFGKLYVSPGFNLAKWLSTNPNVGLERLQALNPGLLPGKQWECRIITLPSM